MTARGTASRYLGSVLRNGLGRYVCQLQRLSLAFSPGGQSSRGARGYIEEKVLDFAKQNPGVVVYVTPQKCRSPTVVAEYCGGDKDKLSNYTEISPEEQLCVAQRFVSSTNKSWSNKSYYLTHLVCLISWQVRGYSNTANLKSRQFQWAFNILPGKYYLSIAVRLLKGRWCCLPE
ncbi:large ribosomal subunit protein mL43 isoform X1 [Lepidochelys kempii]|uniref:large ribosomal subunit protein mL43 isoform X1 n=1 Tax=Lepidochelys kempii TaxID=8472 RepID=UPI003C6FECDC